MIWRDAIKYGPSLLLLVAWGAVLSEMDWIDRTLGASLLYGGSVAAGALCGLIAASSLVRYAMPKSNWKGRLGYVITLCVGLALLLVFVSSILNRAFAPSLPSAEMTYQILEKGHSGRGRVPYIVLATQHGREKFLIALTLEPTSNQVRVTTHPGNLGFDRAVHFEVLR